MKRAIKDAAKRAGYKTFRAIERLGFHVLPVHYYSPVPNIAELERTRDKWAHPSKLPGVLVDLDEQVRTLRGICLPFRDEYASGVIYAEAQRRNLGPGFGPVEAQALHCVVRHLRPRTVIEVGSGLSTWCMLNALRLNQNAEPALICIEPFPAAGLQALSGIELMKTAVQDVDPALFERLEPSDVLFIDSSHSVKPLGDVNYLVLEVLPRLKSGVAVHFHDIYLPYDYPRDLFHNFFSATETSLVRAYLIYNSRMRILFCLSHLHYERKTELREIFPTYVSEADFDGLRDSTMPPFSQSDKHFPSSLYLMTS